MNILSFLCSAAALVSAEFGLQEMLKLLQAAEANQQEIDPISESFWITY